MRLLDVKRVNGRRIARLALFDEATLVWLRMEVDLGTDRVLRTRALTPGNFITTTYSGHDEPIDIRVPRAERSP